jgi:hypothetical protein
LEFSRKEIKISSCLWGRIFLPLPSLFFMSPLSLSKLLSLITCPNVCSKEQTCNNVQCRSGSAFAQLHWNCFISENRKYLHIKKALSAAALILNNVHFSFEENRNEIVIKNVFTLRSPFFCKPIFSLNNRFRKICTPTYVWRSSGCFKMAATGRGTCRDHLQKTWTANDSKGTNRSALRRGLLVTVYPGTRRHDRYWLKRHQ